MSSTNGESERRRLPPPPPPPRIHKTVDFVAFVKILVLLKSTVTTARVVDVLSKSTVRTARVVRRTVDIADQNCTCCLAYCGNRHAELDVFDVVWESHPIRVKTHVVVTVWVLAGMNFCAIRNVQGWFLPPSVGDMNLCGVLIWTDLNFCGIRCAYKSCAAVNDSLVNSVQPCTAVNSSLAVNFCSVTRCSERLPGKLTSVQSCTAVNSSLVNFCSVLCCSERLPRKFCSTLHCSEQLPCKLLFSHALQ
ncbi:hypothetical protein BaRGS_00037860 [Batillaria attramentaria]|uniref:Uncharacterized protein n=1 Tax=Batillaria attramentaria TaxID=370345 RepID=A0ABD0J7E4_9CAEN